MPRPPVTWAKLDAKEQHAHVLALFAAGCSLRGVLADQRVRHLTVAQACELEPYYISAAINHAGQAGARRIGQDNLRTIYKAAAKLLRVQATNVPEYLALGKPRRD